jgi:hypothetical protein
MYMCTVLLPPGVNPIADDQYILSYSFINVTEHCNERTGTLQMLVAQPVPNTLIQCTQKLHINEDINRAPYGLCITLLYDLIYCYEDVKFVEIFGVFCILPIYHVLLKPLV